MENFVNIQQMYSDSSDRDRPIVSTGGDRNYALKFPEGLPVFKLGIGETNVFDVIPFKITNPAHPLVKAGKIQPDGSAWDDVFMYWEHRDFNGRGDSCLCANRMFGERCFVCDEQRRIAEMSPEGWKSQKVKDMFPRSRVMMNIIDWRHRELGVQVFTGSDFNIRQGMLTGAKVKRGDALDRNAALAEKAQTFELKTTDRNSKSETVNEYIYFASPTNGFGVEITTELGVFVTKSGTSVEFAKPASFVLRERAQQYTKDIMDSAHDLVSFLNIPVYEELQEAMFGAPPVKVAGAMETPAHDKIVVTPPVNTVPPAAQQFAQPNVVTQPAITIPDPVPQAPPVVLPPGKATCSYGHTLGDDYESKPECKACQKEQTEQYVTCVKVANGIAF